MGVNCVVADLGKVGVWRLLVWAYSVQRARHAANAGAGMYYAERVADHETVRQHSRCGAAFTGVRGVGAVPVSASSVHPDAELCHGIVQRLPGDQAAVLVLAAEAGCPPDPMAAVVPRVEMIPHQGGKPGRPAVVHGSVFYTGNSGLATRYRRAAVFCETRLVPSPSEFTAARREWLAFCRGLHGFYDRVKHERLTARPIGGPPLLDPAPWRACPLQDVVLGAWAYNEMLLTYRKKFDIDSDG